MVVQFGLSIPLHLPDESPFSDPFPIGLRTLTWLLCSYAALGLIHDLNPSESGGAEIVEQDRQTNSGIAPESSIDLTAYPTSTNTSSTDPGTSLRIDASDSATDTNPKKLSKGHGRIVRDEAGNVLRVELHEEDLETESSALRDDVDMEQLAPQLESNIRQTWVSELGGLKTRLATNKETVIVRGELVSQSQISLSFFFLSFSLIVVSGDHRASAAVVFSRVRFT